MKSLEKIHHSLKSYTIDEDGNIYKNENKLPFCREFKYSGKIYKIEKIIGKIFLENPYNRRIIIFKDGNPENITVNNLEWSPINQDTYNKIILNLNGLNSKVCVKCKEFKTIDNFFKNKKGNLKNTCKKCDNDKRKEKKDIYNENRNESRKNYNYEKSIENRLKYEKLKESSEKYKLYLEKTKNYSNKNWWINVLSRLKKRAYQLNLPFNLDKNDLIIPEKCPLLEIPISIKNKNKFSCVSWDRIKPELGYVKGNVRAISVKANVMKNNATFDELKLFSKNIINYINE